MKTRKRARCPSERMTGTSFLLSFLALSSFPTSSAYQYEPQPVPPLASLAVLPPVAPSQPELPQTNEHDFTLRHIFHHGTYQYPNLHRRLDVPPAPVVQNGGAGISLKGHYPVKSRPLEIQRLVDRSPAAIESHLRTARTTGEAAALDASAWTVDELPGPNMTDRDSVVSLARIAADAYVDIPGEGEWEDIGHGYNRSLGFGWQEDGLRGYIFADRDNSTIVMGLKGTSPAVFDGSETTTNDKLNDNLFFSCCCGQGGQYLWRQVCDCQSSTYTCNTTCLVKELKAENRYYRSSIELYTNVTKMYPNSNIWLTGHSLGGAVSALLGLTFGIPVVAFEAPGDDLPAKRLGLPSPPEADPQRPHVRALTGAYHFGHTADPVFMGSCNGAAATCTFGGYAMESQCHTGNVCVYDTVGDLGWRVGIGNHKIHVVIDSVLLGYDELATCRTDDECVDCFNWKYFESNGTESTTSTSTSRTTTKTRTSTCETPGWWGCLDKTTTATTTTTTSSTSTTTTSTSTCKTPGWFGCKDPTTTTSATAAPLPTITTTPTTTSSSASRPLPTSPTCERPGWFGCKDPTSVSAPATSRSPPHNTQDHHTSSPSSASCETPGYIWGCKDKHHQQQHPITPKPSPSNARGLEWKEEM